jgi:AcrR family transcriptional regulator
MHEIRALSKNESLVQERREQILQGAFELFLRKGYKETKLREIAQACNMPEGTIYRYIGSKDDLLHLICLKRARGRERLDQVLTAAGEVTVTDALKTCIHSYFQMGDRGREINLFFNREIHHFSAEDRHFLLEAQVAVINFFKALIEKGIRTGEFTVRSPLAVAHNILLLGHDWGLRRWFLSQHFTLEQYTEIQIELLLKQISADCSGHNSGELQAGAI